MKKFFNTVKRIFLDQDEYCVVKDPRSAETKKNQLGKDEIRKGEDVTNFFLYPGETLDAAIGKKKASVILPITCYHMKAKEEFTDEFNGRHKPGDEFYVYGPRKYIVPMEAELLKTSRAIFSLDSLGVYVFNPAYPIVAFIVLLYLLIKIFFR